MDAFGVDFPGNGFPATRLAADVLGRPIGALTRQVSAVGTCQAVPMEITPYRIPLETLPSGSHHRFTSDIPN
jgi:hypothetical protein